MIYYLNWISIWTFVVGTFGYLFPSVYFKTEILFYTILKSWICSHPYNKIRCSAPCRPQWYDIVMFFSGTVTPMELLVLLLITVCVWIYLLNLRASGLSKDFFYAFGKYQVTFVIICCISNFNYVLGYSWWWWDRFGYCCCYRRNYKLSEVVLGFLLSWWLLSI